MTMKTFVFTVTCDDADNHPVHFNIVTPDGNYKSGSRMNNSTTHALEKCIFELKESIKRWNENHPNDKFPIKPTE